MNIARAIISLGLFGWFGWAVWTGNVPGGDVGSSKTRALRSFVDGTTSQYGVETTAFVLFGIGAALALFFFMLHRRAQSA